VWAVFQTGGRFLPIWECFPDFWFTYARVLLLPPFSNLADAVEVVNPLGLSLSSSS
jgi:hypothetical protein